MIAPVVEGRSLQFPDLDITWGGECPWTGSFCFGTESGELLICHEAGEGRLDVDLIKVSDEAINGVAFWGHYVGVSTRSDVIVARRDSSREDFIVAPMGAHGILATPGGRFFAPMGTAGLLVVDPSRGPEERIARERPSRGSMNFYKLIGLGDPPRGIMACAARTSGLLTIRAAGDHPMEILGWASPEHVDFIDVCSVPSPRWPHAVIGLALDRSLVYVRDPSADEGPQTLRLQELRGTPYSILSADGHLFVLTSKEIAAFPDLLTAHMEGELSGCTLRYRHKPIEAVEASIAHGRYLMIIMDREVRFFDIPDLLLPISSTGRGRPVVEMPDWAEGEQPLTWVRPNWDPLSLTA